jgi:hypothetical protein
MRRSSSAARGTGYWLALLRLRGVDAIGYDHARPGPVNAYHRNDRGAWISIERLKSAAAARRHPERALLLCWPPYDDDAASYDVLRAYRGDVVIHIGERDEGATGSVRFHRELALNWTPAEELELPHWPRLQDRITVYRRNPVRPAAPRARPAASNAASSSRPARLAAAMPASASAPRRSPCASASTASNIRARSWTPCRSPCSGRSEQVRRASAFPGHASRDGRRSRPRLRGDDHSALS